MYAFTYHAPKTVRQAASLLAKSDDAKILAGGQTLLPTMKQRLASPSGARSTSARSRACSGIELKGRSLVIGATTRHAEVATSRDRAAGDPRPRRPRRPHRRPRGAQPRHHRRLDRQQRSRRPTTRPPAWRWAPPSSPTSARSRPSSSSPACSRPRWSPAKWSSRSPSRSLQARLRQVPQPGLALRHGGRVRGQARLGRPRRGHGRRPNGVFRATALEEALRSASRRSRSRASPCRPPASTATSTPPPNTAPTSSPSWPSAPWRPRSASKASPPSRADATQPSPARRGRAFHWRGEIPVTAPHFAAPRRLAGPCS